MAVRWNGVQVTLSENGSRNRRQPCFWVVYMPHKRTKNQARRRLVVHLDMRAWQVDLPGSMALSCELP